MSLDEIEKAMELAREQMQGYADFRLENGYIQPWTADLRKADDKAEQALTALQQFRKDHVIIAKGGVEKINYIERLQEGLSRDGNGSYLAFVKRGGDIDKSDECYEQCFAIKRVAALIAKQMGGE